MYSVKEQGNETNVPSLFRSKAPLSVIKSVDDGSTTNSCKAAQLAKGLAVMVVNEAPKDTVFNCSQLAKAFLPMVTTDGKERVLIDEQPSKASSFMV